MIESKDIKFDEQGSCDIKVDYLEYDIILYISDALNAYQEKLRVGYLARIAKFLNSIDRWYPICSTAVSAWGLKTYGASGGDVRLLSVHVLFEQESELPVFGLQFRPEYDTEHGAGVKINGDSFDLVEVGAADVAFC